MALLDVLVVTRFTRFEARLVAVQSSDVLVFAVTRFVAVLAAAMVATLQNLIARKSTTRLLKPAWLVFQNLLCANTPLLNQKRALGTRLVVGVAVVGHLNCC